MVLHWSTGARMIRRARRVALAVFLRAVERATVAVAIAIMVGWFVALERLLSTPRMWARFSLVFGAALVSTFLCLGFSHALRM